MRQSLTRRPSRYYLPEGSDFTLYPPGYNSYFEMSLLTTHHAEKIISGVASQGQHYKLYFKNPTAHDYNQPTVSFPSENFLL